MIVSINQPGYLPWLGYFDRIARSGMHILLDHVQFEKNSVTNRNRVRTPGGWHWLTVPLRTSGRFGTLPINKVEILADGWNTKHWKALQMNYARAPFFLEHAPFFKEVYGRPWSRLGDLMGTITPYLLQAFKIRQPLRFSSELAVEGRKDELILNLCNAVGATTYLSGPLGRAYLREQIFLDAGIRVEYHDYQHPVYEQAFSGFEPFMSAIDLLFNCGPRSLDVLTNGRQPTHSG